MMKAGYILMYTTQLAIWRDIYVIAVQNHIDLAKTKSKKNESGFHAMKLGGLRLNLIENAKHHLN